MERVKSESISADKRDIIVGGAEYELQFGSHICSL